MVVCVACLEVCERLVAVVAAAAAVVVQVKIPEWSTRAQICSTLPVKLTTDVANGMAAVDLSFRTVATVARGLAISMTARVHPVYPMYGAASACGRVSASAAVPPMMPDARRRWGSVDVAEYLLYV